MQQARLQVLDVVKNEQVPTNCLSVAIINEGTVAATVQGIKLSPGGSLEFGTPSSGIVLVTPLNIVFLGSGTRLLKLAMLLLD